MDTPTPLVTASRDALADALAPHNLHASLNICTGCSWRATPGAGSLADQYLEHLADALLASGVVRAVDGLAEDEVLVQVVKDGFGEWLFRMHGVQSSCSHRPEAVAIIADIAAALATPTDPSEA